MENRYLILEELELIIQYHRADLTFEGLLGLSEEIINDKNYNPKYRFLLDVRESEMEITEQELYEYGDWAKENLKLSSYRRLAVLTSTPKQVVKFMLFAENNHFHPLKYEVFSTIQHAIKWLNVNQSAITQVNKELTILQAQP